MANPDPLATSTLDLTTPAISVELIDIWRTQRDLPVPSTPELPSDGAMLGLRVVEEECRELAEAVSERDLAQIAEEGIDVLFSTISLLRSCGIPVFEVWREKCLANFSKGSEKDERGKIVKGEHYRPADIAGLLEKTVKLS